MLFHVCCVVLVLCLVFAKKEKKKKSRILALHCTYSFPINLFSFFTCYFGYNSTVLSHRPDFCNSTVTVS